MIRSCAFDICVSYQQSKLALCRPGVGDGFGGTRTRLLDTEDLGDLIHELFLVLPVDAFDLRVLERLFAQFQHGQLLQILPIHTNPPEQSLVSGFVWRKSYHKKETSATI